MGTLGKFVCTLACSCKVLWLESGTVLGTRVLLSTVSVKAINNQLLAVFNFLVTVIGSFVFTYKAVEYTMEVPNFTSVRYAHCMFVSVISLSQPDGWY